VQELSGDVTGSSKNLQQDVWLALKARKESLEAQLKNKMDKLKELCVKEAVSGTKSTVLADTYQLLGIFYGLCLFCTVMSLSLTHVLRMCICHISNKVSK